MAPIYMTPPCSAEIRDLMRTGELGMIATPAQGNRIDPGYRFWIADNGVFTGKYPGDDAYLDWLLSLLPYADSCMFATAPDYVSSHPKTWARSATMLTRIRELGFPVAYVAQDGMEADHSCWIWDEWDAIFIGGTDAWKLGPDAAAIARAAHDMGKWVHVGRVNSGKRFEYADIEMWADSVDGTLLTNGPDKRLPDVTSWIRRAATQELLFGTVAQYIDTDKTCPSLLRLSARDTRCPAPLRPESVPRGQEVLF